MEVILSDLKFNRKGKMPYEDVVVVGSLGGWSGGHLQ